MYSTRQLVPSFIADAGGMALERAVGAQIVWSAYNYLDAGQDAAMDKRSLGFGVGMFFIDYAVGLMQSLPFVGAYSNAHVPISGAILGMVVKAAQNDVTGLAMITEPFSRLKDGPQQDVVLKSAAAGAAAAYLSM
jgi:hypothetical protein